MRRGLAVALLLLLAIPSCSDEPSANEPSPDAFCPRYAEKLTSCGLGGWTESGGFFCREGVDAADSCKNECLLGRSCGELVALLCQGETILLDQCIESCAQRFACENGESIPALDRCDGYDHCSDASDEKACEDFSCDNGAKFPIGFRCDGPAQCPDASDEADCSGRRACATGDSVLAGRFCDGVSDCSDGSDESDCDNWIECVDGSRVSPLVVCDGTLDCSDGADEPINCGVTLAEACASLGSTP